MVVIIRYLIDPDKALYKLTYKQRQERDINSSNNKFYFLTYNINIHRNNKSNKHVSPLGPFQCIQKPDNSGNITKTTKLW